MQLKITLAVLFFAFFYTVNGQVTYKKSTNPANRSILENFHPLNDGHSYDHWKAHSVQNFTSNAWLDPIALPFDFSFFGEPVTHFKVSKNGLLTFDTTATFLPNNNVSLPTTQLPDKTIAAFWDQMNFPMTNNNHIVTNVYGEAPNRIFWIKFLWMGTSFGANFSIILEENQHNIYVVGMEKYTSSWQPALTSTVGIQKDNNTAVGFGNNININATTSANTDNEYYAFYPTLNLDAGITTINAPSSNAQGTQDVKVALTNFGLQTLDSVKIGWSVDNVGQTPFVWNGSLNVGATLSNINIGTFTFPIEPVELKVWTERVNHLADSLASNDTTRMWIGQPLNGVYQVSGANYDFKDIRNALQILQVCGINGPVELKLHPKIYNEHIYLRNIAGSSATNTITINGTDKNITKIITTNSYENEALITIDSLGHLRIKNLTLSNPSLDNGNMGIWFKEALDDVIIDSCDIFMETTDTILNNYVRGIFVDDLSINNLTVNYLTVSNCTISGVEYGIHGNTNGPDTMRFTKIINNNITAKRSALYFLNQDSLYISGNTITITNYANYHAAVWIKESQQMIIKDNKIFNPYGRGIYINEMNHPWTFPWGYNPKNSFIYNNAILTKNDCIFTTDFQRMGIYNNTLVSENYPLSIDDGYHLSPDSFDIRNNILSSTNFGIPLAFDQDVWATVTLDYNLYYDNNQNNYLSNLQSNYPNLNLHSIEANPAFQDDGFHLIGGAAHDGGDTTLINFIPFDFEGDSRPLPIGTRPDIGADEVNPVMNDVRAIEAVGLWDGLCNEDSIYVQLAIQNYAHLDIQTLPVSTTISLNGGVIQVLNDTFPIANLTAGQYDTITLGPINGMLSGVYSVEVDLNLLNDADTTNDTFINNLNIGGVISYTTDSICPNETAIIMNLNTGYPVDSFFVLNDSLTQVLATGSSLEVDQISTDTTLFIGSYLGSETAGKTSPAGGTTGNYGLGCTDCGLLFDVDQPFILKKVSLRTNTSNIFNNIIVLLKDSTGTVVQYKTVHLTNTSGYANEVDLDFYIPKGKNWQLNATNYNGLFSSLVVSTSNVNFPYVLPNIVTIKGTPNGSNQYYYFYDWKILPVACALTPVDVFMKSGALPNNIQIDTVNCFGANDGAISYDVDGGTPPFSFQWSNGDSIQNINNLTAGNYDLTISDVAGCIGEKTFNITEPALLQTLSVDQNDIFCYGNNTGFIKTQAIGGTPNYTYNWSNNTITKDIDNLVAGNYTLTVTDNNGCSDTTIYTITQADSLDIQVTTAMDSAGLGLGTAVVAVNGGTPNYVYQWGLNAGGQTTPTLTGLTSGVYRVAVTDANGCVKIDSAVIVAVDVNDILGVEAFTIFPNPAQDYLNINIAFANTAAIKMDLLDINGRIIQSKNETTDHWQTSLNIENLTKGIYIIRISIDGMILTKRVLIE